MLRLAIAVYVGVYALAFTNIDIMASAARFTDRDVDNTVVTTCVKPLVKQTR